ncbi:MAG: hypothetical protein LBP32_08240 [Spirochaetaceae bacterium]|jgi:regulator of protease activity HflC (stomatin/prohibitin superfamily)|nr:hypothetical protein [Spirochaetaceae bacterium]
MAPSTTTAFNPPPAGPGPEADERNILNHLLEVEADAAALVDDAQAEADRRIAEAEKENRSRYDERYAREVAGLNEGYEREIAAVKEEYRRQLEAYRRSLDGMAVNNDDFFRLVESCLIKAR